MLVDRVLPGEHGQRLPVPQLDTFFGGQAGTTVDDGEEVFRSEDGAYEAHIDDYLFKFCELYYEVAKVLGPRKAMNAILARRDRDRLRCRLAAAKELAELATANPAALRAMAAARKSIRPSALMQKGLAIRLGTMAVLAAPGGGDGGLERITTMSPSTNRAVATGNNRR